MSRNIMLSRAGRGWKPEAVSDERKFDIVRRPIITEKSTLVGEFNQYAFEVAVDATKPEIKAAVEGLFKVTVTAVNTLNQKGKVKRFRGHLGKRKDIKKAIVTLAQGHLIDVSTGL